MAATEIQNSIARITSPLGTDKLLLRAFDGQEEMSRLFQYEAEVFSPDLNLDFNQLLGQPVAIELDLAGGRKRHFHAVVSRCRQVESVHRYACYKLSLVPWFWLLTRRKDCRIFQGQSVPDIVKALVAEFGFSAQFEDRLTAPPQAREYCVQYRESSFEFISRLLEEEGIYYWFEHQQDKHILVLGDSPGLHKPAAGYARVPLRAQDAAETVIDSLDAWSWEAAVESGSLVLDDYNFQQHGKSIQGGLRTQYSNPVKHAHGDLEVFDYPGEYDHESLGSTYARVRLEERHARRSVSLGEGTVRGLAVGGTFQLRDHPRKDQNAKYLVFRTEVTCLAASYAGESGERSKQPSFRTKLQVIPADRVFRPARLTPRPIVQGPQTAVVVGPSGQEIYVDDFARIKVQFHWDRYGKRDENSSCWIRVSQPWAGQGFGCMNIPRIGQEVIVDFLEGDPDRPIINGRVYNGDNMPNPSNAGRDGKPGNSAPSSIKQAAMMTSFKSNSTPGGGGANEITMNDAAGQEGLFFKAQKDEIHNVGNDREDSVGNNETRKVGVDRSREVGNNETVKIGVNRDKTVGTNETESIGANKKITVGANHTEQIGANMSLSVGANQTVNVGGNKAESVAIASAENVGAAKALSVGAGYAITVAGAMNTAVGMAQFEEVGLTKKIVVGNAIEITCGSSTFKMDSSGKITLEGSEISIKASGNITINGAKIDLN
ncbi:MAG: type VI secretion system tip protein VgrG [Verrucomicrobiales bacterium]|nr:type VI secretion system tip protein VgrG [Verrucomicrobiales bacterium]